MAQTYAAYAKISNLVRAVKYTDNESLEEIKEMIKDKKGFSVKDTTEEGTFCLCSEVKIDSDIYTSNSVLRKGDYAILNESSDFRFQSVSAKYFEENYTII